MQLKYNFILLLLTTSNIFPDDLDVQDLNTKKAPPLKYVSAGITNPNKKDKYALALLLSQQSSQNNAGLPGPTGGIGQTGNTGATGATGSTGATGTRGMTGATGAIGGTLVISYITGPVGPTGTTGANSSITGASGATGSKGTTGSMGLMGAQGATGTTGTVGVDGSTGATGDTGTTGAAGQNATTVITGATGATGATGPTGTSTLFSEYSYSFVIGIGPSITTPNTFDVNFSGLSNNNVTLTTLTGTSLLSGAQYNAIQVNDTGYYYVEFNFQSDSTFVNNLATVGLLYLDNGSENTPYALNPNASGERCDAYAILNLNANDIIYLHFSNSDTGVVNPNIDHYFADAGNIQSSLTIFRIA